MIARCSARLDCNAVELAAGQFQIPRHVAERPKESPQAGQFVGQESVAARLADQIVKRVIEFAGTGDGSRISRRRGEVPNLGGQRLHLVAVNPLRRPANRLALQHLPHLTHLADAAGSHLPHHRPTIREKIDDAHPAEFDERLADWSVADTEAVRQRLGHKPLLGSQVAVEDIGQYSPDNGLPAQAMIERGLGRGTIRHCVGGDNGGWVGRSGFYRTDSGRDNQILQNRERLFAATHAAIHESKRNYRPPE